MSLIGEVSAREELARRDRVDADRNAFKAGGLAAQQQLRDAARLDGYTQAIRHGADVGSLAKRNYQDLDTIVAAKKTVDDETIAQMSSYPTHRPAPVVGLAGYGN